MIPFDIEYIRAATLQEAVELFSEYEAAGKSVRYFAGGTELVTAARDGKLTFDVLIDIKRVPELEQYDPENSVVGAGLRLTALREQTEFPLLAKCAGGIADRTVRNSITLGGNLMSVLPYRETALPLLLFDAEIDLFGPRGERRVSVGEVFQKRFLLEPGEILVSVVLDESQPFSYARVTKDARVDYPLATVALTRNGSGFRLVFTGACGYPVRSAEAEAELNSSGSPTERALKAVAAVADRFRDDMRAGAEYRKARLSGAIASGIIDLEEKING